MSPATPRIEARTARIIAVGSELLAGVVADTNSTDIAGALTSRGVRVLGAHIVADSREDIAGALRRSDTDLVVVTGGLGPTHDDLTREALSSSLGIPLREDAALRAGLAGLVARHSDPRSEPGILRQATVLEGAYVLQPVHGTAPGQVLHSAGCTYVLLPGPPAEMRPMLEDVVAWIVSDRPAPRMLLCRGSESDVQVRAQKALAPFSDVDLTLVASAGEVRVMLSPSSEDSDLDAAHEALVRAFGRRCDPAGVPLEERIVATAGAAGITVAVAESCTGGLVAARLTSVPGASGCFLGGLIAYSDELKDRVLGVPAEDLRLHGAVSGEVAEAMAAGAGRLTGSDVAVSVTGIAGPGGGSADKPVGTVWFGIAGASEAASAGQAARGPVAGVAAGAEDDPWIGTRSEMHRLRGDREGVRERSVTIALRLLHEAVRTRADAENVAEPDAET